jgi:nicotinate phosphoribosyltransferase
MSTLSALYRPSLAMLNDLYQLTMAYGYWKEGLTGRQAAFHLTFRSAPFGGRYAVACGLPEVVELLRNFRFEPDQLDYLATLTGSDGRPLFSRGFLDYLGAMELCVDVDAVPEGTPVFPQEPLLRVTGPILHCQLLETPLLNLVNFATLIATKATRVCRAAQGDTVIEFGVRRAQGPDGGITAGRAAFVGGCHGTSNLLAGQLFDIPVMGTHAHSWVMAFESELEAFRAYADAQPNNCIFLVDTYDTREGVRNAVRIGRHLRDAGHELLGVRLDSGDLAELSKVARRILDDGGFPDAKIVASSDLDEHSIRDLKRRGAKITVWGVGTRLATAFDQPALGGIYKLSAVRDDPQGPWEPRIKLSSEEVKTTNPGVQQVRRYYDCDALRADVIFDVDHPPAAGCRMVSLTDGRTVEIPDDSPYEDLLQPLFRGGRLIADVPDAHSARATCLRELDRLPKTVTRWDDPQPYRVGLEAGLHDAKRKLMDALRSEW